MKFLKAQFAKTLFFIGVRGKRLLPAVPLVVLFAVAFLNITSDVAYAAFDANAQATSVLKFIALVILIAAAIGALMKLVQGQVVQAILLVIGAGLLYFLIGNPETSLQSIGEGLNNLFFGGGGGGGEATTGGSGE